MKKVLALLLVLMVLLVGLVGCNDGSGNKDSGSSSSSTSQTAGFVAPEDYASVLIVTINPQFKLYLDVRGEVLAVEPVNDDAKAIEKNVSLENKKVEEVVKEIVSAANDGGFVTENAQVSFEVVNSKESQVSADDILEKVKDKANQTFTELKVEVQISTAVSEKDESVGSNESDSSSQEAASSHTHSFADATCTAPKTCSCGATEGKALGHSYVKGVCGVCGGKQANYKALTDGRWHLYSVVGMDFYSIYFTFGGDEPCVNMGIGENIKNFPEEDREIMMDHIEDLTKIGDDYYFTGKGDGNAITFTENGDTVTVTEEECVITLKRTAGDKLTVTAVNGKLLGAEGAVEAGDVFTWKTK